MPPRVIDPKRVVTNTEIEEKMKISDIISHLPHVPRVPIRQIVKPLLDNRGKISDAKNIIKGKEKENTDQISDMERKYLGDVAKRPLSSVRERYKRLRLASWRGDRIKKKLVDGNLIEDIEISDGSVGAPQKLSVLTGAGSKVLGIKYPYKHGGGGLYHRFVQRLVEQYYTRKGQRVEIEGDTINKKVDVLVTGEKRTIAFEVVGEDEKYQEFNLRDLKGLNRVFFVCRNKQTIARLKKRLEEIGRIPKKVGFVPVSKFLPKNANLF